VIIHSLARACILKKQLVLASAIGTGLALASVQAYADPLFKSTDFIIAVNPNLVSSSSYPAGEAPPKAIDEDFGTKYLNRGKAGSGLIVTPGESLVQSMILATANDWLERDPASYELYGTTAPIVSVDNSNGTGELWTLIASGPLSLPDTRNTIADPVNTPNANLYSSYKLVFPTLKNAGATNSMQIAEVLLMSDPDGGGASVLASSNPVLAIDASLPSSSYPGGESPPKLIDGLTSTKYLNFGKNGSGFIVTPSVGATFATGFELATAGDASARDPASYEVYGTNAPITELDNGLGNADPWTLIASGSLSLPEARLTYGTPVSFANDVPYNSYKVIFPMVKNAAGTNSMQLAEFQLTGSLVPEPGTMSLLAIGGLALLRRRSR